MTKILLKCVKWLRFSGIDTSAEIGSIPISEYKSRKQIFRIAEDLRRLFWIIFIAFVVLAPRVLMKKTLFVPKSLQNSELQVAYMFLRAADIIEMAQTFYPVIAPLGRVVQILVLAVFRKDISSLLAEMQKFVNLSNIKF